MDLRQLQCFLYVVDTQSISKAAVLLHIAQPAVSRQVKALEEELGVLLLLRHGRGVVPTPVGKTLADQARRVLQAAQTARDSVRAFDAEPAGALSFGAPTSLSLVLFPHLGVTFRALYPKVRLHLSEGFSGSIHEWILNGRLDMAVLYETAVMGHLVVTPLLEETMSLVGPAGCFGADQSVGPEALADLPLVLPARPHRLRQLVEDVAAAVHQSIEPVLEIDALPALVEVVRSAGLYTVLPYSAVEALVGVGAVSVAAIASKRAIRRLCLARPTGRPVTSARVALERTVIDHIRQQAERFRWRPLATT